MAKITSFARQFQGGYFPQEHWDESTAVNGHEVGSPSSRKRQMGVSIGSQEHANPGMVGKQDYNRNRPTDAHKAYEQRVASGWELQQDPERKLVTSSVISKKETMAQGEGPKRINKSRGE